MILVVVLPKLVAASILSGADLLQAILAYAIPVALAVLLLASPVVYASCFDRLASIAAPVALSKLVRPVTRLALSRTAARGSPCWRRIAEFLRATGDLAPLQAGIGASCPPPDALEEAARQGFLEPVAQAQSRGCSVPGPLAEESRVYHMLLGRPDRLGESPPRPRVAAYYCSGNRIDAWIDGVVYSTLDLPERVARQVITSFNAQAAAAGLGAGVTVTWGCDGGVRLEYLASIAYPEIPRSLSGLAYHLALPAYESPAAHVAWAASLSARILLESGAYKLLDIPQWVLDTLSQVEAPQSCPEGGIIATDRPRLGCPYYSPVVVDVSRVRGEGPAAAAALALAYRMGDPKRAHWGPPGLDKILGEASAENSGRPTIGMQVPVEESLQLGRSPVLDCLQPEWLCRSRLGLRARVEPGRVEVLSTSVEARDVVDASGQASATWPGSLIVAPSYTAAKLVSASLRLPLLEEPDAWDEWFYSGGGEGVVSWETLQRAPWLASRGAVAVYPEAWPGSPGSPEGLSGLVARLGGKAVSRTLQQWGDPEHIVLRDPEDGGRREASLNWETAVEAVEAEFRRMWKGYRMRPYQRVAASTVLVRAFRPGSGPVMVVLPTGAGKSAIFLSAGMAAKRLGLGGYILVISPLRALMRDQVESAAKRGLRAERIDAGVPGRARRRILELARLGLVDVLYATPERFLDPAFQAMITASPPAMVVLDEAHAVHRWGSSFRPSYLHAVRVLSELYREEGRPHISLYTATAPPQLASEILALLSDSDPVEVPLDLESPSLPQTDDGAPLVLRGPVLRPELRLDVIPAPDGEERVKAAANVVRELADWASSVSEPWIGIVYTGYVKSQESWANADWLADVLGEETGMETISYHGQLPAAERRRREDLVYKASSEGVGPRIVVATKAFGMGVDIPNVRWILHYTLPSSMEDYYQEVGRAGRDGLPARGVALYSRSDLERLLRLTRRSRLKPSMVVRLYNTLARLHDALRENTGGPQQIVVPLKILGPGAMRALDAAARLGLIDYWGVRARLAAYRFPRGVEPSDYLPWYMEVAPRIVVGPESRLEGIAERVSLSYYRCGGPTAWHLPLAVEAGGIRVEVGGCEDSTVYLPASEPVVVVGWPEGSHRGVLHVPGPEEFYLLQRLMHEEEERVREAADALEAAAAARARGGPEAAHKMLAEALEAYFSRPPASPGTPPHAAGSHVSCPRLAQCLDRIVDVLLEAAEWLGPSSVTLAVQEEDAVQHILLEYSRASGEAFTGLWRNAYRRLLQASRGGADLLDYGYIVAVVRAAPKPSALIERLAGYPYATLFSYHSL